MNNLISTYSEKSLEEMLNDCSIDAIIAIDLEKNIIAWNETAARIHDKTKEEVIGKPLLEIMPSMAEDEETVKAINLAAKSIKSFVPASKNYVHRLHTENHFIPLKDNKGNFTGIMNLVHDVAHRIKAEEQLEHLNEELERKNNELEQRNKELIALSNVASHDMKEPLRRIYTAVEAIITGEAQQLSNSGRAHLRRIQSAAQRMGLITDDLLSFVNIAEANKKFVDVDLNNVLVEAKSRLQRLIVEKNALISTDVLPQITGNPELVMQLFKNILHNALKFQPEHIPEIFITSKQVEVNNKAFTEILFRDNGIGFCQQQADVIFNLFTKLQDNEKYRGSGIGLAICKKIMELHDGFIQAFSNEGEGTEIRCYFAA